VYVLEHRQWSINATLIRLSWRAGISPVRPPLLNPSVTDVEGVAVLQVEMKMGAVHVVGLGPKHR